MSKSKKKPFVKYSTIWKGVGGGLSNPGQSKVCRVGNRKVLLTRSVYLNRYGNPVHTACLIKKGQTVGKQYKSTGSASYVVSKMLQKNGFDVRH